MTLLAHLSDLHLLEERYHQRKGIDRFRLSYLSAAVPLDPAERYRNAELALGQARSAGADHVMLTGDLTEDGLPAQYDLLRGLLSDSGFTPDQVTLVPGNHDTYSGPTAWNSALAGLLRAYRATSATDAVTVLDDAVLSPISTAIESQSFMISVGAIKQRDVESAAKLAADPVCKRRTTVLAMPPPPLGLSNPVVNAIDGLHRSKPMRDLLTENASLRVVHGHIHQTFDRKIAGRDHAQILAADAIRNGGDCLRLYKAEAGGLRILPSLWSNSKSHPTPPRESNLRSIPTAERATAIESFAK